MEKRGQNPLPVMQKKKTTSPEKDAICPRSSRQNGRPCASERAVLQKTRPLRKVLMLLLELPFSDNDPKRSNFDFSAFTIYTHARLETEVRLSYVDRDIYCAIA